MLQGGGTQSDYVNLLAKQYSQAVDPAEQQSLLQEYDQAVKTLDDQNTAAANKAAAAAQSNLQKSYTRVNTMATTLTSQIAASIKTGTNQIDPSLMHGSTTVFINPDGTVAMDQSHAAAGSTPVTVNIPAPNAKMDVVDLYHLYGMTLMGKYVNEATAANDPNLTADEQASHESQASSLRDTLATSVYTNSQIAQAEANGQPALVRKYVNGNAELDANPNVAADGKYILNPTTQSIQASLAKQKQTGETTGVDFNMVVDGVPTMYKLRNLGNAAVAEDPSATNDLTAQTYLFDPTKDALVPLNAQHQQEFNQARLIADPNQSLAAETQLINQIQDNYQNGQARAQGYNSASDKAIIQAGNKPGAGVGDMIKGAATAIKDGAPVTISKIDTAIQKYLNPGQDHTLDPLNRLGFGPIGSIASGLSGLFSRGSIGAVTAKETAAAQAEAKANQLRDAQTLAHPAALPPAPKPFVPPKITPAPSQYNMAPLPAPVPVAPGSKFTVPASTGNYQQDVTNLGRSLIGG